MRRFVERPVASGPQDDDVRRPFKVLKPPEAVECARAAAIEQVHRKKYAAEPRAAGADPVPELAAVSDRQGVRVIRGA